MEITHTIIAILDLPNKFLNIIMLKLKHVMYGENLTINNSIIGAGSVVTKNVPDNEVWVGNPARFIRKL